MPGDVIPFDQYAAPAAVFKNSTVDVAKFSGGIQASFAILTFKGKEWGIRYRGVTQQLLAPDPSMGNKMAPVRGLEVVIVDASPTISKVFYLHGYKDGDRTPPDCWSANGVVPDPASSQKQASTCRGCRHNVFGSRITDDGRKGKACSDNKRLAVVPVSDIMNEPFGGPVMLRLPPGSFASYSEFVGKMASKHYPPFAVAVRLSFSSDAFPKIVFEAIRPLNDAEGTQVLAVQKDPQLERMLTDPAFAAFADEGDEPVAQVAPPPAVVVPPPPAPPAPPVVTPPVVTPPPVSPIAQAAPVTTGFGVAASPAGSPLSQVQPTPAPSAGWGAAAKAPAKDDLAIPPHLQRPPVQQPAQQPVEPPLPPPVGEVLTPEQMKIRELEAQLAAAKAAKPRGRPRTQPVAPPNTVAANPVQPVTPQSNGSGEATVGNSIADRIANLVSPKN